MVHKILRLFCLLTTVSILVGCSSKPTGPNYKAVEGKGEPLAIKWNFEKPVTHQYRLEQHITQNASSIAGGQRQKIISKGDCMVSSDGDSTATFTVGNLKLDKKLSGDLKNSHSKESLGEIELKGLQEDGSFKDKTAHDDVVYRTILKLPDHPIAIGATEVIDVEIPFLQNGKNGRLRGKQATTLVGYYEIYETNCLKVDTKYEYYEFVDAEDKVISSKLFKIKGESTIYFDEKLQRVHRSVSECDIKFDLGLASLDQTLKVTIHKLK